MGGWVVFYWVKFICMPMDKNHLLLPSAIYNLQNREIFHRQWKTKTILKNKLFWPFSKSFEKFMSVATEIILMLIHPTLCLFRFISGFRSWKWLGRNKWTLPVKTTQKRPHTALRPPCASKSSQGYWQQPVLIPSKRELHSRVLQWLEFAGSSHFSP